MAGDTSSWKTTVSPMTMAPCPAAVNAAHEPSPANGLSGIPSTFTATSVRGQPMRTTPSVVVVALAPDALPITPASSGAGLSFFSARAAVARASPRGWPTGPSAAARTTPATPPMRGAQRARRMPFIASPFCSFPGRQEPHSLGGLAQLRLAQRLELAFLRHLDELERPVADVAHQNAHRVGARHALDAARLRHARQPVEQLAGLEVHDVEA